MSWWGWLILAANIVGFVVAWRWNAYGLAHEYGEPDGDDVIFSLFFGAFLALVWPICILYHLGQDGRFLLSAPPKVRRKEKREQLERRINELERELGIGRR